tara:strand:+ start:580 stop:729 length:150 start_codon:yes stop_codon:yes gene_type:complete
VVAKIVSGDRYVSPDIALGVPGFNIALKISCVDRRIYRDVDCLTRTVCP